MVVYTYIMDYVSVDEIWSCRIIFSFMWESRDVYGLYIYIYHLWFSLDKHL